MRTNRGQTIVATKFTVKNPAEIFLHYAATTGEIKGRRRRIPGDDTPQPDIIENMPFEFVCHAVVYKLEPGDVPIGSLLEKGFSGIFENFTDADVYVNTGEKVLTGKWKDVKDEAKAAKMRTVLIMLGCLKNGVLIQVELKGSAWSPFISFSKDLDLTENPVIRIEKSETTAIIGEGKRKKEIFYPKFSIGKASENISELLQKCVDNFNPYLDERCGVITSLPDAPTDAKDVFSKEADQTTGDENFTPDMD